MIMSKRFKDSWRKFKHSANEVKDKITGVPAEKIDMKIGIYLHKNIATIFFWDKKVQRKVKEINQLARDGERDDAVKKSKKLKIYLTYKMNHDRFYQKKTKEISEKLEGRGDLLKEKFNKLSSNRFMEWIKKQGDDDSKQ